MTTDARLALVERQRRYAWDLARDQQTRTAAKLVAGKTHDLLNLIQIVQLAAPELNERATDDLSKELTADIAHAASDAHVQLGQMMAVARPDVKPVRGPAVGGVLARVAGSLDATFSFGIDWGLDADAATSLDAEALEHLMIALVLDAGDTWIELTVRERAIAGAPWIEIVRGLATDITGDRFDLKLVEVIASRAGGELSSSERRGGGSELVVALPVL
ncbi:MAG TPA: hypothetical protein VGM90_19405 [Kofleriaceae bacterium]|jgi:hypothetical protein